jgi:hypothetical protein
MCGITPRRFGRHIQRGLAAARTQTLPIQRYISRKFSGLKEAERRRTRLEAVDIELRVDLQSESRPLPRIGPNVENSGTCRQYLAKPAQFAVAAHIGIVLRIVPIHISSTATIEQAAGRQAIDQSSEKLVAIHGDDTCTLCLADRSTFVNSNIPQS